MTAEAFYEIFKATLPQKEQERFKRILKKEGEPTPPTKKDEDHDLRMQILMAPKRKIPNVS